LSRQVGIASLIWGASILLSRVIGLVREAVIGRVIGGGGEADVYWTAFIVPDFLNYLLAGGALSLVFIPIFAGHMARGDTDKGWAAFSAIANVLVGLLLIVTPLLWLAMPSLVPLVAPGFDAAARADLVHLSRIVLPAQVFHLVGGLLSAVLQAQDKHVLPALAPLLYAGGIIAGGIWMGSAEGFAWGVLVGSILGPFGMPLLGTLKTGLGWRPGLWLRHPDLRTYVVRTLPIMLGFSIVVVDDWILRRQGSMLPEGSISTLQYAKTLMKVPMGVFGLATGVAAYPTLSRLFGSGADAEAHQVLNTALRRMLVLAFGAQVALTCAGTEIAALVYGDRLPRSQHEQIGMALAIFGLGLWAWAAQTVIARGFYAQGRTWLPTIVGSVVVVASYPLYAWMGAHHGVLGLPVATSVAITTYVSVLHLLLRRGQPQQGPGFGQFLLRAGLAVAVGIGAGLALRQHLHLPSDLLQGAVLAVTSGLAYLAAAKLFAVPEVDAVLALVQRRLKR
jgi:putative peptidoglycan lipid II flippase